jgi:Rhodopirellula transposase DDE domain
VEQIEHRLFSHISMNWRGRPLTSHEVIVQTTAATRAGLRVHAELDNNTYPGHP